MTIAWEIVEDSGVQVSISDAARAKLAAEERDRATRIADTYRSFGWFGRSPGRADDHKNSRSVK